MENKENLSGNPSRKPWTARPSRKTAANCGSLNECYKKKISVTPKTARGKEIVGTSPEIEELNKKKKRGSVSDDGSPRRPNTVSGRSRKKLAEKEYNQSRSTSKCVTAQPKNHDVDPKSTSPEPPLDKTQSSNKTKPSQRSNSPFQAKDFKCPSLLPKAVYEQELIIEMLRSVREELIRKMMEKIRSKAPVRADFADNIGSASSAPCLTECFYSAQPSFLNFENSYSGTLEDIFQAWVNLFYFIINLNINLIRLLNSGSAEPFCPDFETEQEIVEQAIECVKFFSNLKMKSLINSLEELHVPDDHNISEIQIRFYEEQISSPFLFGMDFIQKKAKEILEQAKK